MQEIKELEEARRLMKQAMDWSVMKWLNEKKRVRLTADLANETLDRVENEVHQGWDEPLKSAYARLNGAAGKASVPVEIEKLAKTIKETHDAAIRTRMEAEDTFAKAEQRLSTRMAREGCERALAGWDLHEAAIRKAEAVTSKG